LFDDAEAMEQFLATICTSAWNEEQDAGRSFAEATALLCAQHPQQAALIEAYDQRWEEMLAGPIDATVEILGELRDSGIALYALTNWSHEKFPIARRKFPFLQWFDDIVVSGEVRMKKPDPRIFQHLLEVHRLSAPELLFIDDSAANVAAARGAGLQAVRFTSPEELRAELTERGLLS
jgi:2-haloacid dehalogenase